MLTNGGKNRMGHHLPFCVLRSNQFWWWSVLNKIQRSILTLRKFVFLRNVQSFSVIIPQKVCVEVDSPLLFISRIRQISRSLCAYSLSNPKGRKWEKNHNGMKRFNIEMFSKECSIKLLCSQKKNRRHLEQFTRLLNSIQLLYAELSDLNPGDDLDHFFLLRKHMECKRISVSNGERVNA